MPGVLPLSIIDSQFCFRCLVHNVLDCDEFLEGYGGEVKMDGNQQLINTYVDCIWIIGRFPHMARTFDRIYLKVALMSRESYVWIAQT